MAELSYSMSCVQSVIIDFSQYVHMRTSFMSQWMYLGSGIIRYNADKDDRLKTSVKSLKEEIPVAIVDVVIEMSSVALQWNYHCL